MPFSSCERLTPTEKEVLRLLAAGMRVTNVAEQTGRALSTARSHVKRLHYKTATHDIAALTAWAEEHRDCCIG